MSSGKCRPSCLGLNVLIKCLQLSHILPLVGWFVRSSKLLVDELYSKQYLSTFYISFYVYLYRVNYLEYEFYYNRVCTVLICIKEIHLVYCHSGPSFQEFIYTFYDYWFHHPPTHSDTRFYVLTIFPLNTRVPTWLRLALKLTQ